MVGDNQFSALGLVLLSELAKVARIIQPPAYAVCALGDSPLVSVVDDQDSATTYPAEDLGEAVPRVSTSNMATERLQINTADRGNLLGTEETGQAVFPAAMAKSRGLNDSNVPIEVSAQVPSRWTRRRRRKGMNAIDDVFGGLD